MKLALIFDIKDRKLLKTAYSQTYRDMFMSLYHRFDEVQCVNKSCSAKDIEADCIIFFDVHSTHDITIDGLKDHKAVKYTFFNDPHQQAQMCRYPDGHKVRKLGARERIERMRKRDINYIICPYKDGYYRWIAPYVGSDADDILLWFPVAPNKDKFTNASRLLVDRKCSILANGATWEGKETWGYDFRRWAFKRPNIYRVNHCILRPEVPSAGQYPNFLSKFAGALALTGVYVVPKYLEIPLAGCLCFAEYLPNYDEMGFRDGIHCIFVDKDNFDSIIVDFLKDPAQYQSITDAGRKHAEDNWTSQHFADYIYKHAEKQCAI